MAIRVKVTFYEMGITCHLAAPKGVNGKAKGNALENKHALQYLKPQRGKIDKRTWQEPVCVVLEIVDKLVVVIFFLL